MITPNAYLSENSADNPLSKAISDFLDRQLFISGYCHILYSLKIDITSVSSIRFIDENKSPIIHSAHFEFDSSNQEDLKSYYYLTLIAQAIENFESYLKNLIRIIIGNPVTSKYTLKGLFDNSERLKFIKKQFSSSNLFASSEIKELVELFYMVEKVRHIVTHQNQIYDPIRNEQLDINSKLFLKYFSLTEPENRLINKNMHLLIFDDLCSLAYHIFFTGSSHLNYPIDIRGRL